ncbi:MAG: tRNA 2-thiocytidine(32) synthetase TtcA [Deltaproteobacteria bacterium]|nr:tRNA 2-thiocytidine(32) synthetase TtcA [Deltaproteobacteria bacterium]
MSLSASNRIRKLAGKAIGDFGLIDDGDHIAVGISGGKDSMALMRVLEKLRQRAPVSYRLIGVTIDPGFPGFPAAAIGDYFNRQGMPFHCEKTVINEILAEKRRRESSWCSFCARLRRGILYTVAQRLGCNKIALGHHLDDFIETLLLNQFYSGTIAAMSPKLLADNGIQTVIRPLAYVEERAVEEFVREEDIPVFESSCPALENKDRKRQRTKELIANLEAEIPQLKRSLRNALGNVQPRHLWDLRLK